jgi:hypothetical protein
MDDKPDPKLLEHVDEGRRASLKRILQTAFVLPVIASFAMSGLGVNEAYAGLSNGKTCGGHQHQPQPQPISKPTDPPHSHHK